MNFCDDVRFLVNFVTMAFLVVHWSMYLRYVSHAKTKKNINNSISLQWVYSIMRVEYLYCTSSNDIYSTKDTSYQVPKRILNVFQNKLKLSGRCFVKASRDTGAFLFPNNPYKPVFRIRDLLVRIGILGSVLLTNWSGSVSYFFHQWPSRRQLKYFFSKFLGLLLFEGTFTSFFKDKSHKEVTKQ